MNLSLKEINYVLTVHAEGSITKAAQALYIAQPSLSQSIQKIEGIVGVPLFSRTGNRVKLTYAGERFVEAGIKIQKICRDLENELTEISNLDAGRIVLGIPYYLGSYMFPQISNVYKKAHPKVQIILREGFSSELEGMVESGLVDIAIMPVTTKLASASYIPIFHSRIILSIPQGHWLEQHVYAKPGERFPYVDVRLIGEEPFLAGLPGQRIRQGMEYVFQKAAINPPIVFESRSIETIKMMSEAGMGLAIMPEYYQDFFKNKSEATYCYLEDEYSPRWVVSMVYPKKSKLSATIQEFIDLVLKTFADPPAGSR